MILIDMMMLIRRCYAKMDFLKNDQGVPTGMEFGSLRTIESLHKKFSNHPIVLCFDSPGSFRREYFPEYKANRTRNLPDSYYARLAEFKKFLCAVYSTCEYPKYEADDVMYTLAKTCPGGHLIYTNDKDLLQAVGKNVTLVKSFKSNLYMWDSAKIVETYGVTPNLLPIYFAFVGDKVDNVTGVLRITKKFIASLILWAHRCNLSQSDMLQEIMSADWSDNMRARIKEFINLGLFARNLEMVKLHMIEDLKIVAPTNDEKLIVEMLNKWDIRTLDICKGRIRLEDEEF